MVAPTQGRTVPPTDGKRRALLVDPIRLGKSKRADRPLRGRVVISAIVAVFVIAAGAVILSDLDGEATAKLYSPGHLCETHVNANVKCFDCHVAGTPMREGAEGGSVAPAEKWGRATDVNCRACHPVVPLDTAVPNLKSVGHHSFNELDSKVRACAACHREHRGSDADLRDVPNHACADCHRNLSEFVKDASRVDASVLTITGFDTGHPDFPSLKKFNGVDPGMIKFTHQRHTTFGLVKPTDGEDAKMYWSEMKDGDRELLGGPQRPGPNDVVKLNCATCHEPDINSDGSVGRNMKPPNFDRHCKVCHPVDYQGVLSGYKHGQLTSSLIHRQLEDLINSSSRDVPVETLDLDGVKSLSEGRPQLPRHVELLWPRAEIVLRTNPDEEIKQAKKALRNTCFQCHYFVHDPSKDVPLPDVEYSNIRSQKRNEPWLTGALFDHRTHDTYNIQCLECHVGKLESPPTSGILMSSDHKDILIPNRSLCLKCHSNDTAGASESYRRGGTSCLLCHVYHKQGNTK